MYCGILNLELSAEGEARGGAARWIQTLVISYGRGRALMGTSTGGRTPTRSSDDRWSGVIPTNALYRIQAVVKRYKARDFPFDLTRQRSSETSLHDCPLRFHLQPGCFSRLFFFGRLSLLVLLCYSTSKSPMAIPLVYSSSEVIGQNSPQ